jgi:chemotaxis protein MotB
MSKPKPQIIIHMGAPEWMVTFGDMTSLLLTFFILLCAVAKVKDTGKVYDLIYALQGMFLSSRPVHGYLLPNYAAIMDDLKSQAEEDKRHFGEMGVHGQKVKSPEGDGFYSMRSRDQLKIIIEGNILFEEGSALLLDDGKRTLERLLVPRFQDGPFRIVIRGHSAPGEMPTSEAQDDLGYDRAREVRDYFVQKGIPVPRFEIQTVGDRTAPVGGNPESLDARRLRRRVEIYVSPQAAGPPIEASSAMEEK